MAGSQTRAVVTVDCWELSAFFEERWSAPLADYRGLVCQNRVYIEDGKQTSRVFGVLVYDSRDHEYHA
jgi:hypothetical protein